MNANVDINAIKQYNTALKQYKDQAANINAEINFLTKEIDNLCADLTRDLGITVTKDNIEQVCKDLCEKINSTLNSGNAILSKIAGEVNKVNEAPQATLGATEQSVQPAPVAPINTQAANVGNNNMAVGANTLPPMGAPVVGGNETVGDMPTFASVGGSGMGNNLPPFFSGG